MTAARRNLSELGRHHANTGNGSACPTLIGKPAYFDAFVAAWRVRNAQVSK